MIHRRLASPPPRTGTGRSFLRIGSLLLVAMAALAAPKPISSLYAQEVPRLASLEIGIWPEYDRPAALVILRGELAADVQLPATVPLSIPASSGGPSAVASTANQGGVLITRSYELTDAGDQLLLTLTTPDPLFQVEFYDILATDTPDREYTYVWPGHLAVDQLSVRVQEPAGATGLSVEPDLGPGAVQADGLVYRQAQMGAFEVGAPLTVRVRYHKTDPRTSVEILGQAQEEDADGGIPSWLLPATAVALVIVAVAAAVYWRSQRRLALASERAARGARRTEPASPSGAVPPQHAFCTQCGRQLAPPDRFCSRCGAKVRRR